MQAKFWVNVVSTTVKVHSLPRWSLWEDDATWIVQPKLFRSETSAASGPARLFDGNAICTIVTISDRDKNSGKVTEYLPTSPTIGYLNDNDMQRHGQNN